MIETFSRKIQFKKQRHFYIKITSVNRKNTNSDTKPSTVLKMLECGVFTKAKSINSIHNSIHNSQSKRMENIFGKYEFIPKMHAFRDCINDIDFNDISQIHYDVLGQLKKNKFFDNHTYRGTKVVIADGVEFFETSKNIEGLHLRNHKNGDKGYYYKALGIMYLTDDVDVMLELLPFNKYEVADDNEHNKKIKSEGEITVFKRALPSLKQYNAEVAVLDCMFLNAPCLNEAKNNNIDVIVKLTDERRDIYKDSSMLFTQQVPKREYEIVEVIERKIVKYSKESKKKNIDKSEKYFITRSVTNSELNKSIITENKTTKHPKKTIINKISEKVIKRVKVYADDFELNGYNYGLVKVLKSVEETKDGTKEMYIVTTLLNDDLEFIVDVMHRRWDIELSGFRKLKDRYNLDHLYVGTLNAIKLIMYLVMIIYNFIELYFNIHTKKYRHTINYDNLLEDYKIEIAKNKDMYKYFIT